MERKKPSDFQNRSISSNTGTDTSIADRSSTSRAGSLRAG